MGAVIIAAASHRSGVDFCAKPHDEIPSERCRCVERRRLGCCRASLGFPGRQRTAAAGPSRQRPRRHHGRHALAGSLRWNGGRLPHQGSRRRGRGGAVAATIRRLDTRTASREADALPVDRRRQTGTDLRRSCSGQCCARHQRSALLVSGLQRAAVRSGRPAHRQQRQDLQPEHHSPRMAEWPAGFQRQGGSFRVMGAPAMDSERAAQPRPVKR